MGASSVHLSTNAVQERRLSNAGDHNISFLCGFGRRLPGRKRFFYHRLREKALLYRATVRPTDQLYQGGRTVYALYGPRCIQYESVGRHLGWTRAASVLFVSGSVACRHHRGCAAESGRARRVGELFLPHLRQYQLSAADCHGHKKPRVYVRRSNRRLTGTLHNGLVLLVQRPDSRCCGCQPEPPVPARLRSLKRDSQNPELTTTIPSSRWHR